MPQKERRPWGERIRDLEPLGGKEPSVVVYRDEVTGKRLDYILCQHATKQGINPTFLAADYVFEQHPECLIVEMPQGYDYKKEVEEFTASFGQNGNERAYILSLAQRYGAISENELDADKKSTTNISSEEEYITYNHLGYLDHPPILKSYYSPPIILISGEPTTEEVFAGLEERGFSPEEAMAFYGLRMIRQWKAEGKINKDNFDEVYEDFFNEKMRFGTFTGRINVEDFKEWHRKYVTKKEENLLNKENGEDSRITAILATTQDDIECASRTSNATYLQRLSNAIFIIRDQKNLEIVNNALNKYDRVAVAFGLGHHEASRPAYENFFGSAQIISLKKLQERKAYTKRLEDNFDLKKTYAGDMISKIRNTLKIKNTALSTPQIEDISEMIVNYARETDGRIFSGKTKEGLEYWYMPEKDRTSYGNWKYMKYLKLFDGLPGIIATIDDNERCQGTTALMQKGLDDPAFINLPENIRKLAEQYIETTGRQKLLFAGNIWYLPLQDRRNPAYSGYEAMYVSTEGAIRAIHLTDDEIRCHDSNLRLMPLSEFLEKNSRLGDHKSAARIRQQKDLAKEYANNTQRESILITDNAELYIPQTDRENYSSYLKHLKDRLVTETSYLVTRGKKEDLSIHMFPAHEAKKGAFKHIHVSSPGAVGIPGFLEGTQNSLTMYTSRDPVGAPLTSLVALGLCGDQAEMLRHDEELARFNIDVPPLLNYDGGDNKHITNCIGFTLDMMNKAGIKADIPQSLSTSQFPRFSGADVTIDFMEKVADHAKNNRNSRSCKVNLLKMYPEIGEKYIEPQKGEQNYELLNPEIYFSSYNAGDKNYALAVDLRNMAASLEQLKEEGIKFAIPFNVSSIVKELKKQNISIELGLYLNNSLIHSHANSLDLQSGRRILTAFEEEQRKRSFRYSLPHERIVIPSAIAMANR